ncbi:hypothetical protein Tco_1565151 [Tanacetum coccineum]
MHNNIMAVGSKDHPPMLATWRYVQWESRFLRYVNTESNKQELKQCIFDGLYVMIKVIVLAKPATTTQEAVPEHTVPETYGNTTLEKHACIDAKDEAINMTLSGIRDDIYFTVDSCTTAKEMWIAIERLNKLEVASMQVNVQFLQQLQQEWSRFVTVVKQTSDLDTISYHKLFVILKQYQNEVNDIRAEKIARNANPLALVAATQQNKGKEIVKPITPPPESASNENNDEHAQRDKQI